MNIFAVIMLALVVVVGLLFMPSEEEYHGYVPSETPRDEAAAARANLLGAPSISEELRQEAVESANRYRSGELSIDALRSEAIERADSYGVERADFSEADFQAARAAAQRYGEAAH